jgi:pimeloyl-ACP methyl ester carboxylesterase
LSVLRKNPVAGEWVAGTDPGVTLVDPILSDEFARVSSSGVEVMSAVTRAASPAAVQVADFEYHGAQIRLEYAWIASENSGPLIVFLHEGLGSLSMWRGFPATLCAATGSRGLIYSRCGYGESSSIWPDRQWPVEFMRIEARELLPRFFGAIGLDTLRDPPVLFGHSDGGSIALIHAALYPDRISRLVVLAPHIFVEDITVASIAETRKSFVDTNLAQRLRKYHRDVEQVFWGWTGVWLDPAFRRWTIESLLCDLACPTLAVQGRDDNYGTMRQIEELQAVGRDVRLLKLSDCGHSPHVDHPDALIEGVAKFLNLPRSRA